MTKKGQQKFWALKWKFIDKIWSVENFSVSPQTRRQVSAHDHIDKNLPLPSCSLTIPLSSGISQEQGRKQIMLHPSSLIWLFIVKGQCYYLRPHHLDESGSWQTICVITSPSIHPMIHGLSSRRCPMSPHFLTT